MQYFYPEGQLIVALYFALVGAMLCMLYDIFRIKREFFGASKAVLFADDLLYMIICTLCTILGILKINSGNVRWYETFFALLGFWMYRITLSRVVMMFFCFLSKLIKSFVSMLLEKLKLIICPLLVPINKLSTLISNGVLQIYSEVVLCKYKRMFYKNTKKACLKL